MYIPWREGGGAAILLTLNDKQAMSSIRKDFNCQRQRHLKLRNYNKHKYNFLFPQHPSAHKGLIAFQIQIQNQVQIQALTILSFAGVSISL